MPAGPRLRPPHPVPPQTNSFTRAVSSGVSVVVRQHLPFFHRQSFLHLAEGSRRRLGRDVGLHRITLGYHVNNFLELAGADFPPVAVLDGILLDRFVASAQTVHHSAGVVLRRFYPKGGPIMGSGSTTVVLGFLGALGAGSRAGCGGGGVSMGAGASNRPPPSTQRRMTFSALGSPSTYPRHARSISSCPSASVIFSMPARMASASSGYGGFGRRIFPHDRAHVAPELPRQLLPSFRSGRVSFQWRRFHEYWVVRSSAVFISRHIRVVFLLHRIVRVVFPFSSPPNDAKHGSKEEA